MEQTHNYYITSVYTAQQIYFYKQIQPIVISITADQIVFDQQ